MTNGDFAFFTFRPLRMRPPNKPWNKDVGDRADLPRRRQAYYAIKQVRPRLALVLRRGWSGKTSFCSDNRCSEAKERILMPFSSFNGGTALPCPALQCTNAADWAPNLFNNVM